MKNNIDLKAELQISLIETRRANIKDPQNCLQEYKKLITESGFDGERLKREWLNEVIDDIDAYTIAAEDAERHFEGWLKEKIDAPFRVGRLAIEAAERRFGNEILYFHEMTWDQEIAWAHRLRRSDEPSVVLMSEMFLKACKIDIKKEFNNLAAVYIDAIEDMSYRTAPENSFSPEQIRFGYGNEDFKPLFLRYAEKAYAEKVSRALEMDISVIVNKIRQNEENVLQAKARDRAVVAISRSKISRMGSVIRAAIELKYDAYDLARLYEIFQEKIIDGTIKLPSSGGLPHSEFLDWMRVQKGLSKQENAVKNFDNGSSKELKEIVENRMRWVKKLPDEYREIGGEKVEYFHQWLMPFTKNEVPVCSDMILSFGFFLMNRLKDLRPE